MPRHPLIDYGAGNVPSVERALQRLGVTSKRVSQPRDLAGANAIILPGVGHYAALIRALDENNLRAALLDAIANGRSVPWYLSRPAGALFDPAKKLPTSPA